MNRRLGKDLDMPIRIGLWTIVVITGVVTVEPVVLDLPGDPLAGVAAIGLYLALARLAIALALGALREPAGAPFEKPPASDTQHWIGPSGAMSFQIFGYGAALLTCGLGQLPGGLAEALPYVTLRLGALLLGLGLAVRLILHARTRVRRP